MSSVTSDASEIGKPQEAINEFWDNLITKKPTKVTKVFPTSLYKHLLPPLRKPGTVTGKNAAESYRSAAEECRARVQRIVRECHRTNEKFTDPDFDITYLGNKNCLQGLKYWLKDRSSSAEPSGPDAGYSRAAKKARVKSKAAKRDRFCPVSADSDDEDEANPSSVHRIDWIFDDPKFEIDGFSSSDLCQGYNGDCWFIAAVATICSNQELIKNVCVERDEECGVYGFVFYRDGEWIWTVVDDNLYLKYPDFDAWGDDYDPTGVKERRYKKNNQTGSEALYFASCADENETWLPLLEKAYAKVHGDYAAIAGGWSGEAVEDLTGGVTNKIVTDRVLSRNRLWKELLSANKDFLFSASSPGSYGNDSDARRGLALSHAYSVIRAVDAEGPDGKNNRLVLIRNPWGRRLNAAKGEWTGPWSDGAKEWTPYWLEKLNHTFGDDGLFWMSYDDLLKRFDLLDRTRLFNEEWTVVQHWTSVSVAWVTGFLNTKFSVEIKKGGPTVFVLCQLDERYFRGLEGKYDFDLHFILQKQNTEPGDHIVRARGAWFGNRSISAEVDLDAGLYEVIPKIDADRDEDAADVYEVLTKLAEKNPQKLRQIGLNYDIANSKGAVELSEEEKKKKEKKKKEAAEKKKKEEERVAKEKEEFENWKKEEKAEYEAWKKVKLEREEKDKAGLKEIVEEVMKKKEDNPDGEGKKKTEGDQEKKPEVEAAKTESDAEKKAEDVADTKTADEPAKDAGKESEKLNQTATSEPANEKKEETKKEDEESKKSADQAPEATSATPAATASSKSEVKKDEPKESEKELPVRPKEPEEPKVEVVAASDHGDNTKQGQPEPEPTTQVAHLGDSGRDSHMPRGPPSVASYTGSRAPRSVYGEPDSPTAEKPPGSTSNADDNVVRTWNAVCVLGLRVYSKDPEVTIKLVKPKDAEEAAILDVDGETPAGATM